MLLAIDIGNTCIDIGLLADEVPVFSPQIPYGPPG